MGQIDRCGKRTGRDGFRVLLVFFGTPESDLVSLDLTVTLSVSHGLEKGGRQQGSEDTAG